MRPTMCPPAQRRQRIGWSSRLAGEAVYEIYLLQNRAAYIGCSRSRSRSIWLCRPQSLQTRGAAGTNKSMQQTCAVLRRMVQSSVTSGPSRDFKMVQKATHSVLQLALMCLLRLLRRASGGLKALLGAGFLVPPPAHLRFADILQLKPSGAIRLGSNTRQRCVQRRRGAAGRVVQLTMSVNCSMTPTCKDAEKGDSNTDDTPGASYPLTWYKHKACIETCLGLYERDACRHKQQSASDQQERGSFAHSIYRV